MKRVSEKVKDIVEVCPAYDHADITAIAAASVVQVYLQILAGKVIAARRHA